MRKNLTSGLIILLALMPIVIFGQSTLRTPYSQYGLGELQSNVFAAQLGMGGTGVGMRTPNLINMANPASLTAQDTNSFVFDVGVTYKASQYEMNHQYANHFTSNIDHLAASFPILAHRWFSSIALLPFSKTGYSYSLKTNSLPLTPENQSIEGSGGLSRLNWSNGFIITKNISLGVSASYLFGTLTKELTTSYPFETNPVVNKVTKSIIVGGFYWNYGAQYHTTNETNNFVVGITFQNQGKVKTRFDELLMKQYQNKGYNSNGKIVSYTISDTISYDKGKNSHILMPTSGALGLSWNHANKIIVAAEVSFENWSQSTLIGQNMNLNDKLTANVGLEYTPDPRSYTSYLSRVHYRIGSYYNQSEIEIKGKRINDYGVSAGLGMPFFGNKSTFNVSYQYGIRGASSNNLLSEKYSLINFGFSFYDIWFIKRRLN